MAVARDGRAVIVGDDEERPTAATARIRDPAAIVETLATLAQRRRPVT
jgi:hypothetical protein